MNLLDDPWLPVVRRSGRRALIRPADLTNGIDTDPIVGPGAPRPDFDGAVLQFLVGLLQTAFAPRNDRAWGARFDKPPTPAELTAAFEPYRAAFALDGDGPRFMQDLELDPGSTGPTEVRQLLIDAPGENTLKNNADTFVRGDLVNRMSRASAALALFTLQINAPSGGAGHRTGLRGGGPLTTMLVGGPDATLWESCWLNILPDAEFASTVYGNPQRQRPADVFPWLSATRTSEKTTGCETTMSDVHPAHVYWSTPRRIQLIVEAMDGPCDIDGSQDDIGVGRYATVPWGLNYTGPWRHPLTPAVMSQKGERINRKMRQGGLLWRDWPALALGGEGSETAAVVVALGRDQKRRARADLRIAAFGYDMDNMKARCWYRADMPFIHIDDAHRADFRAATYAIVEATRYMDGVLGKGVLEALANRGTARGSTLGASISGALWRETEAAFYETLHDLRTALEADRTAAETTQGWHAVLARSVPRLFDAWVDIDQRIHVAPEAVIAARKTLLGHLHGKKIRQILDLPDPPKTKASAAARKDRP